MNAPVEPVIGQTLISIGLIGNDQLRIALTEQQQAHRPLGRICVELGFITETMLRDALSERFGRRAVDLTDVVIDPAALALVPETLARQHTALPLAYDEDEATLTIAMTDPQNLPALDALWAGAGTGGLRIVPVLATDPEIRDTLDRHYGYRLSIDDILEEIEHATDTLPANNRVAEPGPSSPESESKTSLHARRRNTHPTVRLLEALMVDAVKNDASDVHFEPEAGFLRIRYRIDGILYQVRALHARHWPAMAVRLKVIAGLNIAETRAPQDGRVSMTVVGRKIDFRVSTLPTLHGEKIVLRILDRERGVLPLDKIGFDTLRFSVIKQMLARPEGLILVTGPTGCGKTTTLYAMLDSLNEEGVNIMTLEDPVEYPMPRLRQTSIGDNCRIDFASGVRALLRQDPDIILVGEIRDAETAEMALRAAMTGHRVFATLHAHSAIGAIARLVDLGIRPQLLAGNLSGVIAQRLVRRLCPHCREKAPATEFECHRLGLTLPDEGEAGDKFKLMHPVGCPRCQGRGYRGRIALFETLRIDEAIDELIAHGATQGELAREAQNRGHLTLVDDGLTKAFDGATSLDELCRVIGPVGLSQP